MTEPLTPPGCDLRDFPHTPLFRSRLFGSSFHARSTDSEWRAGVTLWLKSWDQVPAGSLPNDDIELCRLAELARDVKTWKKVRDGALRGWMTCDDGRLYHPVVAEGVNNALEKKAAQRAKTAKARLAAMQKRLKECTTDDERAHVTAEIEKLQQSLSLTSGKSVTGHVTGSKEKGSRREGEGEGEGSNSDPGGSGAGAPTPDAAALNRAELWTAGKSLLLEQGMPKAQCGTFVGKLVKDYGEAAVVEAVRRSVVERPADAASFLKATCLHLAGQRGARAGLPRNDAEREALNAQATAEAAKRLGFSDAMETIDA